MGLAFGMEAFHIRLEARLRRCTAHVDARHVDARHVVQIGAGHRSGFTERTHGLTASRPHRGKTQKQAAVDGCRSQIQGGPENPETIQMKKKRV